MIEDLAYIRRFPAEFQWTNHIHPISFRGLVIRGLIAAVPTTGRYTLTELGRTLNLLPPLRGGDTMTTAPNTTTEETTTLRGEP
jgi:hypothetical protein